LLAIATLNAVPGERICDLCAAPGGKSTAILEAIDAGGWLLANEAIRSRVGVLRFSLARHGSTRFAVSSQDPRRLSDLLGPIFDAVLVDAPCSGQSLFGRGKQTESAFGLRSIEHCAARQARILAAAARLVRPEGRLVYSTCTFSYQENEEQIASFLERHPGWRLEPRTELQPWESGLKPGCYRLWPHRDGCAGAFAAALRQSGGARTSPSRRPGERRSGPLRLSALPKGFAEWGALEHSFVLATSDRCFAWPDALWPPLREVCVAGPEVSFRKGGSWFPAYALAMRRDPRWTAAATVSLGDREARAYLQGGTLPCNHRGWAVAAWQARPLGWLKGDGVRAKNHLPKPARLAVPP
jgi:hypothetical protein